MASLLALAPIQALGYHQYSIGNDTGSRSGNNYYSGVSVVRYDSSFTLTHNSDCSVNVSGPAVYQSMWVAMDPTAGTWLELGTGHKTCNDGSEFKWWYAWMSNPNGFSNYLWTQPISGVNQHRFFLANGTDGNWRWYIDQTQEAIYYWPNLGFWLQAGLESWDSGASALSHSYDGMVKTVNWSGWLAWTPGTNPWGSCRSLNPPSSWCVTDAGLSGNYLAADRGWASEP